MEEITLRVLICRLDEDTYKEIAARARSNGHSLSGQAKELLQRGIEDDRERVAKLADIEAQYYRQLEQRETTAAGRTLAKWKGGHWQILANWIRELPGTPS